MSNFEASSVEIAVCANILVISVTPSDVKFDIFKVAKLEHPLNMFLKVVAFTELKLDKSRLVRPEHPSNIPSKFVTFVVLKFETSKLVKLEQLYNMFFIVVAALVVKFDKSKLARFEHPENISEKSVTFSTSKSDVLSDVSDEQFLNIPLIVVIVSVLNFDVSTVIKLVQP